jgi:hypothetical protein
MLFSISLLLRCNSKNDSCENKDSILSIYQLENENLNNNVVIFARHLNNKEVINLKKKIN